MNGGDFSLKPPGPLSSLPHFIPRPLATLSYSEPKPFPDPMPEREHVRKRKETEWRPKDDMTANPQIEATIPRTTCITPKTSTKPYC